MFKPINADTIMHKISATKATAIASSTEKWQDRQYNAKHKGII